MAGQPEFRFRHVLVRDVCYQRLPRTERVARHERTADWLDALVARAGTPTWPRCSPTTGGRPTRSPGSLGMDTAPATPAPAREALHRAARRAYALHGLDAAASHAGRALGLADDTDPVDRLQLELLSTEISFYRDGNGVPLRRRARAGARARRPAAGARRRRLRRAGLDAARPGRLAARRPGRRAGLPGPGGGAVRAAAGQRRRRRTRTPSWAGCTCSTTSATRRSPRPTRRRRSPSGWA